jgi:predicted nucleic acid-binding protein
LIAILDSSVAVKWYAREADSDVAEQLLSYSLGAPDFILAEVANALWKKVRKKEIVAAQAAGALPHLAASVTFLPSAPLLQRALELAMDLGHPVYDCIFLALAEDRGLPLITSDERLVRQLEPATEGVELTLLRDWRSPNVQ